MYAYLSSILELTEVTKQLILVSLPLTTKATSMNDQSLAYELCRNCLSRDFTAG